MKLRRLGLVMLALGMLTGCTGGQTAEGDVTPEPSASTDAAQAYPIVIEHAFGETVIESKPERVVTVQWGNHDVVLALGVIPVGFSAANYGVQDDSGLLPWTKEALTQLGEENPNVFQDTDGLDFEAIADANPDVILAPYSGITEEDYALLSEIAPVVAYPEAAWMTQWREQVQYIALGMGMVEEGEQLIADTEALVAEKAAAYDFDGVSVAWVNFNATDMSKLHLYTPTDPRGAFLEELGFTYPESIISLIEDPSKYSLQLSAENVQALYDVDVIVGYGGEELYEAVKADPVLGQIPAIQRGSVVFIGNGTPLAAAGNPNPLSIKYTADEYFALLGEAVAKLDAQ